MERTRLCIILPAFNEASVIGSVLQNLKKELKKLKVTESKIVVVDDGSFDKTIQVATKEGAVVLRHIVNRGLGGALATGLAYANQEGFDVALTMDSDGQHDPTDIKPAIEPILKDETDVVIGSRLKSMKGMPWDRVILNWLSNGITWLLFDYWTTDSQSGFRVFNRKALDQIQIRTQGMEVSSEFFAEIKKHKLRLIEVPIRVRYTDYSRAKGQTNLNSFNVGWKLILRLFR